MKNTKIEWTDNSWNPVYGCRRVSPGCQHCYAERIAGRFGAIGQTYFPVAAMKNGEPHWTGKVKFNEKVLFEPLDWPQKYIFADSMSDLFYEKVSDDWRDKVFGIMALCGKSIFQVLTKRPEPAKEYFAAKDVYKRIEAQARDLYFQRWGAVYLSTKTLKGPLGNLWLGVSAEDQEWGDKRVKVLRSIPAKLHFVSCEPLLGPIRTAKWFKGARPIGWIIAGGESGHGARALNPQWVRDLRGDCQRANVPFFFKQWGAWSLATPELMEQYPDADQKDWPQRIDATQPEISIKLPQSDAKTMKAAGALIDGMAWTQMPEDRKFAHVLAKSLRGLAK